MCQIYIDDRSVVMDPETHVNQRVEVLVLYRSAGLLPELCRPYKMRFKNRDVTFTELGLRHPTKKGQRMVHVFDMSDGTLDYRLEFDAEALTWTLVSIVEVSR